MSKSSSLRLTPRGGGGPDRATVPVQLEVPRTVYRRAMDLTGAYASLPLGQVLERWVEDAAHAASHLDSWEHKQLTRWLRGHPFPRASRPRRKHRGRPQPEEVL